MANQQHKGFQRLINATGYSWKGFKAAYANEEAFRQEFWLTVIGIPLAIWLAESGIELALMIGALMLILITELLNSGIEAVVDRIGPEHHELSGRAKDIGSAAVFVSLVNAGVVWAAVLWF
ncbi:MAG: diacylglycerol kinase [Gammaproteobacteria bacterium]|nr:diacylglycerol kinase [Gammaproteobacteria bacterium]